MQLMPDIRELLHDFKQKNNNEFPIDPVDFMISIYELVPFKQIKFWLKSLEILIKDEDEYFKMRNLIIDFYRSIKTINLEKCKQNDLCIFIMDLIKTDKFLLEQHHFETMFEILPIGETICNFHPEINEQSI